MGRGGSGGEGVLEGDIRIVVGDVVVVGRPIVTGAAAGEDAGAAAGTGTAGAFTLEGAPDIGLAEAAEEAADGQVPTELPVRVR